jgi:hypothetical protein
MDVSRADSAVSGTTGILTGTTGVDTEATLSVNTAGGVATFYIENRIGSAKRFAVKLHTHLKDT